MPTEEEMVVAKLCEKRLGDIWALWDLIGRELKSFRKDYNAGNGFDLALADDFARARNYLAEGLMALCHFSREEVDAILDELRS